MVLLVSSSAADKLPDGRVLLVQHAFLAAALLYELPACHCCTLQADDAEVDDDVTAVVSAAAHGQGQVTHWRQCMQSHT